MASEPLTIILVGPGFHCTTGQDRRALAMLAKQLLLYAEDAKITGAVVEIAAEITLRPITEEAAR